MPFAALGLSRRVLDAALLARAEALGASVVRGHSVRLVDGVPEVAGLGRFGGHTVFLATGKHDLRGARRQLTRAPEDLVGLKMYLRLEAGQRAALAGAVEVVLFEGGYGGLQAVEGGGVNLCLLMERAVFAAAGENWAGVQSMLEAQSGHLRERLRGAATLLERPLAIFRVPYGFVHRDVGDGVFRLGDQMAVIPSFSGDGVSMALHSAFRAVGGAAGGRGGVSPAGAAGCVRAGRAGVEDLSRGADGAGVDGGGGAVVAGGDAVGGADDASAGGGLGGFEAGDGAEGDAAGEGGDEREAGGDVEEALDGGGVRDEQGGVFGTGKAGPGMTEAADDGGGALATTGGDVDRVGFPGDGLGARELGPGLAFPGAEILVGEAVIGV